MFDYQLYLFQNPWKTGRPFDFEWVEREIISRIAPWMDRREIIVLTGSRQVGKTTIMKYLIRQLLDEGVSARNIFYFSLDDEGIKALFSDTGNFISFLEEESNAEGLFLFIDEIQRLENGGLFLKTLYDLDLNLKIVASGSSSLEIRSKVAEHLSGRKVGFQVTPFSFSEFLRSKKLEFSDRICNWNFEDLKKLNAAFGYNLQTQLDRYLIWGGYPKVVLENGLAEKEIQLGELFNTYVQKDVTSFFGIQDTASFNKFLTTLAYSHGGLYNMHSLSQDLGIYREKIISYLSILENTFVIKQVLPFFSSKKKEITKMPKVYFQDNGIRNYCIRDLSTFPRGDTGSLAEGFCLSEIKRESKFWRTQSGAEVDFIIEGKNVIPVEVKLKTFKHAKIEKSLTHFIDYYKPSQAIVVTRDFLASGQRNKTKVWFIPIYFISGLNNLIE